MKGIRGLIIAIGLGIAGALCNYVYLSNKSRDMKTVYFIGIKPDRPLRAGDRLTKEHLERVPVPVAWAGSLKKYAVLYEDIDTVPDQHALRDIDGGTLLLYDDLKTPGGNLWSGGTPTANDRAWGIPVDTRQFPPSLIEPGAKVSFLASTRGVNSPTPATHDLLLDESPEAVGATEVGSDTTPAPPSDIIGPFTVLAMGNRLGSAEVMQASRVRQVQENVMIIRVRVQTDGTLEPLAQKLRELLERTGGRPLGYLLHPPAEET